MGKRLSAEEKWWRSITERDYQTQIVQLARMTGWAVFHHHDSRRQVAPGVFVGDKDAKGFPDLILLRPPQVLVIEVKRELGKTTPEQDVWLRRWSECGITALVARPSNWPEVERAIRSTRPLA